MVCSNFAESAPPASAPRGAGGAEATLHGMVALQMGQSEQVRSPQNDAFPYGVCIFRCSGVLMISKEENREVLGCLLSDL